MTLLDGTIWSGSTFDGAWRRASREARVTAPASGEELGTIGLADPADLDDSVELAITAQRRWAATSFEERAAVLRRAGLLWEQHASELAEWITKETGATAAKASAEVHWVAQELYEAAALTSAPLGQVLPTAAPRLSLARRVPAGVIGVISPFNFPAILGMRSVAPALALMNAVILKPDPRGHELLDARRGRRAGLRHDLRLSLGILTRDVMKGLALADRIPTGIVHVNDQTVGDEAVAPFGGVGDSGTGSRFGGAERNIDAFTETQWVALQAAIPAYPF